MTTDTNLPAWALDGYESEYDAGIGYGRCDRCSEPFKHNDEMAEVGGGTDDVKDNLIVHVGCMKEGEDIA